LVDRVYFKEVKQNLGFLKEAERTVSAGLCLSPFGGATLSAPVRGDAAQGRSATGHSRPGKRALQTLTYAALLWQLFRSLIEGALDGMVRDLGESWSKASWAAIDQSVESFLEDALQISDAQVAVQLKAEELGHL